MSKRGSTCCQMLFTLALCIISLSHQQQQAAAIQAQQLQAQQLAQVAALQQQQQQAQAAQIQQQQQQQQQAAIAAALSAGVNPMVAAGNPLAIAALQAQQNHPLMAQQASAQLAAAQQVCSLNSILLAFHNQGNSCFSVFTAVRRS